MNFFESNLGRDFFQVQIPKLISTLSEIADALRIPRPILPVQAEIPANFLSDLYYGNLEPPYVEDTPELAACTQRIIQFQEEFYQSLPPHIREQVENYRLLLDERYILQAERDFAEGYRFAMTLLFAGLSVPNSNGKGSGSCHNEQGAD